MANDPPVVMEMVKLYWMGGIVSKLAVMSKSEKQILMVVVAALTSAIVPTLPVHSTKRQPASGVAISLTTVLHR